MAAMGSLLSRLNALQDRAIMAAHGGILIVIHFRIKGAVRDNVP